MEGELERPADEGPVAQVQAWVAAASAFDERGQPQRAVELLEAALALAGQTALPDYPDRARLLDHLGQAQQNVGSLDEAEATLRQAVDLVGGPTRPTAGRSLHALANVLVAKGDLDGAEEAMEAAIGHYRETVGVESRPYAAALHGQGAVLERRGDLVAARQAYASARELAEQVWGRDHPRYAAPLHALGTVAYKLGETEEARRLLEHALRVKSANDIGGARLAPTLANLLMVYVVLGDSTKAETTLERLESLPDRRRHSGYIISALVTAHQRGQEWARRSVARRPDPPPVVVRRHRRDPSERWTYCDSAAFAQVRERGMVEALLHWAETGGGRLLVADRPSHGVGTRISAPEAQLRAAYQNHVAGDERVFLVETEPDPQATQGPRLAWPWTPAQWLLWALPELEASEAHAFEEASLVARSFAHLPAGADVEFFFAPLVDVFLTLEPERLNEVELVATDVLSVHDALAQMELS